MGCLGRLRCIDRAVNEEPRGMYCIRECFFVAGTLLGSSKQAKRAAEGKRRSGCKVPDAAERAARQVFVRDGALYAFRGLGGKLGPIGVHAAMLAIMAGARAVCTCTVSPMLWPDIAECARHLCPLPGRSAASAAGL